MGLKLIVNLGDPELLIRSPEHHRYKFIVQIRSIWLESFLEVIWTGIISITTPLTKNFVGAQNYFPPMNLNTHYTLKLVPIAATFIESLIGLLDSVFTLCNVQAVHYFDFFTGYLHTICSGEPSSKTAIPDPSQQLIKENIQYSK